MKNILLGGPVSNHDLSRFASPAFGRQVRLVMGQDATPPAGQADQASIFKGLVDDIGMLLKDIPPEAVGVYSGRLKACQDIVGDSTDLIKLGVAAECLRKLYEDLKRVKPASPAPTVTSGFPYVPVAVAAVGLIGVIAVIAVVRKGKGSGKGKAKK
jgi:hypothetical protein